MAESKSNMPRRAFVLEHDARRDGIAAETADGKAGSVKRKRWNDGVDAEPSCSRASTMAKTHRAAADAGDDAIDICISAVLTRAA